MKQVIIVVWLLIVVSFTGCGGGSVEHEYIESPQFSGQRTRIHVRSKDEPTGYRVLQAQSINLHIHADDGHSVCIEVTTER